MSCDCDYAESPSVFHETRPKARKRHKCCECRGWIEPGEFYERYDGIWDGRADCNKTCLDCVQLRADIMAAEKCHCFVFGNLHEHASEVQEYRDRYVAIMEKRGVVVHKSWKERIDER